MKIAKITRRSKKSGQALIMMVFFIILGILILGLVIEVGHIFLVKRQLQADADAGATYGAMQLDTDGVRESEGGVIDVLSPGGESVAGLRLKEYMATKGFADSEWNYVWGRCALQINLNRKNDTIFASLFGIRTFTVAVSGKSKLSNSNNPNGCG